jgi:two-component system NtrC family response regulator
MADTMTVEGGVQHVVGESTAMREAMELARKVASTRLTAVLIVGDTGTGKELLARTIHYAGLTNGEPFVAVNCASIPEHLLESELFGHERGATPDAKSQKRGMLELAGAGTLFLEGISALPQRLQPHLLRAIEDRRVRRLGGHEEIRVNCRIVAASNDALPEAVSRLEFREDLYYRLSVFRITLPPLREREDDVLLLARHFLELVAAEQGLSPKSLKSEAVAALRVHTWPGNVRELKHVIERAAVLCESNTIGAEHLMVQHRTALPAAGRMGVAGGEIHIPPAGKSLALIEREAISLTLQLTNGNRSAASRVLGISRPTLARKLREYGMGPGTQSTS